METDAMPTRRSFLTGLLASGLAPYASWADAGSPAYLAAAKVPSGGFALFGLRSAGARLFEIPLPGRGHAAAAHPSRPLAGALVRRPGHLALATARATGATVRRLYTPVAALLPGPAAVSAHRPGLLPPELGE